MLGASNTFTGGTTISAGVLALANTGALQSSVVTNNLNGGLVFSTSGVTYKIAGLAGGGNLALTNTAGGALTLSLSTASGATSVYSGTMSGGGGLTVTGSGKEALSGANTYTGNTTILSGLLQLGNGGTTGVLSPSSTIVLTGGTLGFDNTAGLTQGTNFSSGAISGGGSLLVSAGQVTMTNAANSFTGNIVINGGTLNANATGTAGGASVLGTFSNNSRTITVNSGGMLYYSAKDIQGGESTTDGPVIIVNGGTFYNNSIHNYLATPLTLNGGTLTATDGDSWGNPSLGFNLAATVFNLSGTSVINGTGTWPGLSLATATTFDFTAPGSLTVSVPLWNRPGGTTSASLIEAGSGLLILTASNQYNGTTTISSGSTLQLGNGGSLNPASAITDNGTFVLNNAGTLVQGTSFSTAAISGSGNLVVSAGSATLNALNTYTGGTIVNGGTLALATGGTAGAIIDALTVNPGGTVNLTAVNALGYSGGHVTTVSISGGVMLNSSGGNEGLDTNFNLTAGTMSSTSGGYQFNMSGASILTNGSTASSVISGPIGIQGNSLTFNVSPGTVATGIDLLVSGVISGGDPVTKTGNGVMELTGANTFTGNVVVSAGTLVASHDAGGSSAATALGNVTAGQTITVDGGAVLQFASQNVMGEGTLAPPRPN